MTQKTETHVVNFVQKINSTESRCNGFFAEREDETHLLCLSALTGHHTFLIGDPGTGKDALLQTFVESFAFYTDEPRRYFRRLFGPTLSPDEVFGGFDIKQFEEGNFVRNIEGFAPTAYICNFTELFKGNDVINNTLLDFLNERKFRNGPDDLDVPLLFAVASSNEMPEDNQGALVDRLALKKVVKGVTEKSNLFHIWQNRIAGIKKPDMSDIGITVEEVLAAREAIDEVDVSDAMLEMMFLIVNEFRLDGLDISVRKQNLALDIVRAEAILNGRVNVEAEDFAVLQHVLWNDPDDAHKVRQIILRVANPMMDEIHTGIDAAKKALDEARSQIKNGAGEEQRIRVGSQARHEISAILKGLKQMSTTVNTDTKTGKEIRRAHNRVTRYQKSLMSEVFDLDVDALTQLVEENV